MTTLIVDNVRSSRTFGDHPAALPCACYARGDAPTDLPRSIDEAHVWIRSLQRAYHGELHYRERLERQHTAFRQFVEVVAASPLLWKHGPLRWLRRGAKECLERDQEMGVLIQSSEMPDVVPNSDGADSDSTPATISPSQGGSI